MKPIRGSLDLVCQCGGRLKCIDWWQEGDLYQCETCNVSVSEHSLPAQGRHHTAPYCGDAKVLLTWDTPLGASYRLKHELSGEQPCVCLELLSYGVWAPRYRFDEEQTAAFLALHSRWAEAERLLHELHQNGETQQIRYLREQFDLLRDDLAGGLRNLADTVMGQDAG